MSASAVHNLQNLSQLTYVFAFDVFEFDQMSSLKSTTKDTEADNPIIRLVSGLHQLRTTFLNFLLLPCFPGGRIFIRDALTSAFQSSLIPLNAPPQQSGEGEADFSMEQPNTSFFFFFCPTANVLVM